MTQREQIDAFLNDVAAVCLRYRMEFELEPEALIGALNTLSMDIFLDDGQPPIFIAE